VAVIWAVGEAWDVFSGENMKVVSNAVQVVGLALPLDRSEDYRLSIKELANCILREELRDWANEEQEIGDLEVDIDTDSDDEINFAYE